MIVYRS